jgi:hypothetical protein
MACASCIAALVLWLSTKATPALLHLSAKKYFSEPFAFCCHVWSLLVYLSTTSQIFFLGGGHLMKMSALITPEKKNERRWWHGAREADR